MFVCVFFKKRSHFYVSVQTSKYKRMYWKVFSLKNSFRTSNYDLIHRASSYRFLSKSINRNQLLKIDRTLTRSAYSNRIASSMIRTFSTTDPLAKGSITKMSNIVNPTGPMLAIRREDASIWERRSPLAPFHVKHAYFIQLYNYNLLL